MKMYMSKRILIVLLCHGYKLLEINAVYYEIHKEHKVWAKFCLFKSKWYKRTIGHSFTEIDSELSVSPHIAKGAKVRCQEDRRSAMSTLLHATVYMFLHNLLNVLVQTADKMGLCDYKKK
jgi:hypothetical protein